MHSHICPSRHTTFLIHPIIPRSTIPKPKPTIPKLMQACVQDGLVLTHSDRVCARIVGTTRESCVFERTQSACKLYLQRCLLTEATPPLFKL